MLRFEEVLREHGQMLSRIVASYEANPAFREELMQEVSVAIWQALPRFQGGSLKAYVARIAQNRCISHIAKAVREPKPEALNPQTQAAGGDPEKQAHESQRRQALLDAIRRLPLPLRQVVILALEGFSHREISESLGITENNAQVRYSRAKAELRKELAGYGRAES